MGLLAMQRLQDGRKPSPAALKILESALAPAAPARKHKPKTKLLTRLKDPVAGANPFGVETGQVWISLDPRTEGKRRVLVIGVGATHALVRNTNNEAKSLVALKRFCGKTRKGYRLGP